MAEKIGLAVKKPESKGKDPALAKTKAGFSPSVDINSPLGQMLYLQRAIGNQAVSRMIRSGVLQAKLTIGQPGDIYEQEADRVAGQVMRMTDETQSLAQRKPSCPACEEEEKPISRKESGSCGGSDVMSCVESHINVLKGKGQSLSPSARSFFEPRFGSDFSNVRIHNGSDAAAIATEINAKAFTTGRDIFFNTGQYSPGTTSGKNLLAHELTHVLQQRGGAQIAEKRISGVIQRLSFGSTPPAGTRVVPASHRPRVLKAVSILDGLTSDRRCREFFKDKCTAGLGNLELETALNNTKIYEIPTESEAFGASRPRTTAADPRTASYNLTAYRIGHWMIASTLLHEMFHTCILGTIPNEEITAENAVEKCRMFTPWILEVTPRSGPVGTVVMIRGFEFGPTQASLDKVKFNGVDAGKADSWVLGNDSYVRIRVKVPTGASSGPIVVENNGIPSNGVTFTVT